MMQVNLLTEEAAVQLYHEHMEADFPEEELKPLSVILSLIRMGAYEVLGCFDGDKMVGYALFEVLREDGFVLLDYYAVCRDFRNTGIGSIFLKELLARYENSSGVIAEVEIPAEGENEEEVTIRTRRIRFYERLGFRHLPGIEYSLYGVPYAILLYHTSELEEAVLPAPEKIIPVLKEFHRIIWNREIEDVNIVIRPQTEEQDIWEKNYGQREAEALSGEAAGADSEYKGSSGDKGRVHK